MAPKFFQKKVGTRKERREGMSATKELSNKRRGEKNWMSY